MMKNNETIILAVIVFFSLVTYYLVEPYAHHVLHKHVESEKFEYVDLPLITKTGDVTRGQDLVMGAGACAACHSIEAIGMAASMEPQDAAAAYGVNPPDLSNFGAMLDPKYLAAFIADPAKASNVAHKFTPESGKSHPMPAYNWMQPSEIADMVAYMYIW